MMEDLSLKEALVQAGITPSNADDIVARLPASALTPAQVTVAQTLLGESLPGNMYATTRMERARQLKSWGQLPGLTLSYDFTEEQGSNLYDKLTDRVATLNAGTVSWDRDRGVLFNGSGAFQYATGSMDGLCGEICDLSTLAVGEAITIALVYSHSATLGSQHPLFYYGCSSENTCGGWGLVARTNGKIFFYHRAVGSSAEFSMALANRDPANAAGNNTFTAVCAEIRINPVNPEYFEIAYADRSLEAAEEISPTAPICFSNNAYMPVKGTGGTGPAKYSTRGPLTIGGKPAATYTNLTPQIAGAGGALFGLRQLHIQRYRWVPGRFQAIVHDLVSSPKEVPTSLFMEA